MTAYSIDARSAWQGDARECARLYRQFAGPFLGKFSAMRRYYGWPRAVLAQALRCGKGA